MTSWVLFNSESLKSYEPDCFQRSFLSLKFFHASPGIWLNFLPLVNNSTQKHWTITTFKSTWTGTDSNSVLGGFGYTTHLSSRVWCYTALISRLNSQFWFKTWKFLLYPMVITSVLLFPTNCLATVVWNLLEIK